MHADKTKKRKSGMKKENEVREKEGETARRASFTKPGDQDENMP